MSFDDLLKMGGEKEVMKKSVEKGAPVHGIQSEEFLKYFDHVTSSLARVSTGTKMAVVGDEEIGKTHFTITVPKPVTYIITDSRLMEILFAIFRRTVPKPKANLKNFKEWLTDKEYYVYHAIVMDEKTGQPDYIESVEQFKKVLAVVAKHVNHGTFVIDNTSDLRLWLNALVDKEAQFVNEKTGMPYRFEWGSANEVVRKMTETFRHKKIHFCLTAHTKPKYGAGGKEVPNQTEVDWNRKTSGDLDLIMEGRKIHTTTAVKNAPRDAVGPYIRAWTVRKATKWPEYTQLCGNAGIMEDMTWPKLRQDIIDKIGFDIEEIQE